MKLTERQEVGPVLLPSAEAEAVLCAIREANPAVRIEEKGSYLRVLAAGQCVLRAETVSKYLGHSFVLPADLEKLMPAFKGHLEMNSVEAVWKAFVARGDR